jgi:hypothetical protein
VESDVYYPQLRNLEYMAHFDFTMTYRWDSDVPLMYWWPALRQNLLAPPHSKTEQAEAVFFSSNLHDRSGRIECVRELMPRAFHKRELARDEGRASRLETIARYRFDLAFENSISTDYVTEKFFDPLTAGCVPVYRGAPNIADFAPGERCYIDAADFHGPRELAEYLLNQAKNPAEYETWLEWKKRPFRETGIASPGVGA